MFKLHKLKTFMTLLIICTFLWVSPAPTFAASSSQIVLVLDGIPGESTNAKYKDAIDIYSFSFVAAAPASSPGKAVKPSYSDLNFQKQVDSASLPLLKKLANGGKIASGTIYFFNKGEKGDQTPYLVIRLKNIMVTSVQYSGASDGGKPSESMTLSAKELQFEYTPIINNGKPGPKQTVDIDIEKNVVK